MRSACLSAATLALLIAVPARAERKNFAVTLAYTPGKLAAQCPDETFLRGEVARRLGYDLFAAEGPKHLAVTVSFHQGQYQVVGEMRDEDGKVVLSEVFKEPTCEAAIMDEVNSMAAEFVRPPEPCPICPPAPEPLTCPPVPPASPVIAAAPAPPAERPRAQAGLASVFSIGVAPVVVGGVSGLLGVRWKTVSLALEGSALFAPSATIKNFSVRDGYHYLVSSIAGAGCYHANWIFGCARAEIGVLTIGYPDTTQVTAARSAFLGFGLRFGGEWALTSGLALRAYSELSMRPLNNLFRDGLTRRVIWPGSSVSGSIGLGPVFSFSTL
jgi:hypothetical protein